MLLAFAAQLLSFSIAQEEHCDTPKCGTTIIDLDFVNTFPILEGPNQNWRYFQWDQAGLELTNDGNFTVGPQGGKVNSNPFTSWYAPNLIRDKDDLKWLITALQPVPLPATGVTTVEWIGTAETFNTQNSPFPDTVVAKDDARLAAAVFNMQSTVTGIAFVWLLTNNRVYAAYRRTPYHRQDLGENYFGFTYLFPVAKRHPSDWHVMKLVLDNERHSASYVLGCKEVFKVRKAGFKPDQHTKPVVDFGGVESDAWPQFIEPAFGTVSNLYAYPADTRVGGDCPKFPEIRQALVNNGDALADIVFPVFDPIVGPPSPASYFDPIGTSQANHIWGQGVELGIKRLRVIEYVY